MRRRGSVLIAILLITLVLAIMGMGFLGSRVAQYRGAARGLDAAQARALARAGLEDARVKLEKDENFPPIAARDQTVFTYSENVMDAGVVMGTYQVSVDTEYRSTPFSLIRITSVGVVGPRAAPTAQATVMADLDTTANPVARVYRFLRWEESTNL